MSRFLSSKFENLKAYVPGEQPKNFEYIKLNTNESPYPPAPQVIEAITKNEIDNLRLYSDPDCKLLREKLAEFYDVMPNNIILGNGSDEILSLAFMAYGNNSNGVSYPDISYGFYQVYAELYGAIKNEIPLRDDFTISASDYCNINTTVIIANPNAPTGICLSIENIEKIASTNPYNVVIIDEAYVDFGGESCIPLTKKYDNLLVVQTFSKSRSLAGARLGYAIGNEDLISDLNKLRYSTNPYNINRLTLLIGKAAIEGQPYYDKCNAEIIEIREITSEKLIELGFKLTNSKTNFIFAKHPQIEGEVLYEELKERGILVRHFNKPRISDYVRITVGTKQQMNKLLIELKEMLANEKV